MSEISFNLPHNVFTSVSRAVRDSEVTPAEMQDMLEAAGADHQLDASEQSLFDHLAKSTPFSISSQGSRLPLEPLRLTLPAAFDAERVQGKRIGSSGQQGIFLGAHHKGFSSEREALKHLRELRADKLRPDKQDFALLQGTDGSYHLFELKIPRWGLSDARNLRSYGQLRAASFSAAPAGTRLIGVFSQALHFRSQTREAPVTAAYAPIPNPRPGDSLTELRKHSLQALNRLQDMEAQLGRVQDHRGIFAAMYRVITERGITEMDKMIASGDTAGAEFEARLLVNFANKYFAAYDAYSAGDVAHVPEVWRAAFDAGRNAEASGYSRTSVTEVTALSMIAHIIHDLPMTLKEIDYTGDPHQEKVYDQFNGALMEEKDRILGAITRQFGPTDLDLLESAFRHVAKNVAKGCGERVALALEQGMFSGMREIAKWQSQNAQIPQIEKLSLSLSDASRSLPGGN